MGEVYRATDASLKRQVAIKVLPASVASDADRLARFQREAEVLASLSHPNVASVYGLERADTEAALVMELVEGPTLAERIATGSPLPVDEALAIARQIIDALETAHDQGIVHRDLKPANVKVRPDGAVKVLDFGLAKVVEPGAGAECPSPHGGGAMLSQSPTLTSPAMTQAGFILGTAAYMSPEQARGRHVDRRADIWAFGCVLYEMLTGRRVFEADDVSLTLARVLEREADLSALPANVPARVRQVIALCLRKDVRQRVQSMGDVRLALDGAFDVAPDTTTVTAAASRRPLWQRAAPFAALTAVFAAVIGFVATRPVPVPAVMRFQIHAPAGATLPLGTPAPSPDGRSLAYTVVDADKIRRLHVRPIDRVDTRGLPDTEGAVHPFWSPDGRQIAFATTPGNQLKLIDVAAGAPRTLTTVGGPWHGTWNQMGTLLFTRGSVPLRVPAEGGEPTPVAVVDTQRSETGIAFPFFLADGQRFLVRVTTDGKSSVQLGRLGSTDRTLVIDGVESAPLVASSPTGRSYLFLLRDQDLVAYAFDEAAGTVAGEPVVFVSGIGQVATPAIRPSVGFSPGVLAYQSGGTSLTRPLAWVDRSGADIEVFPSDASLQSPRLSPDGLSAVGPRFDSGIASNVWVTDLVRRSATRITFSGFAREAVWSPDGRQLAFRRSPLGGAPGIYLANIDGSSERRLTDVEGAVTSWSPDGKYLLYHFDRKLMMRAVTGNEAAVDVGSPNGDSRWGAFSLDGRFIAYQSAESGRNEIYVRTMPPAIQRVKVSINGGTGPRWRRDGKEMYFLGPDNEVMAVDVSTGDAFTAGVPRELFNTDGRDVTPAYDVNAAGTRFLLPARVAGNSDSPITVVLNWWVELEQRLGSGSR